MAAVGGRDAFLQLGDLAPERGLIPHAAGQPPQQARDLRARLDEAEEMYRVTVERYDVCFWEWHYFCCRTGFGDRDAAREAAQSGLDVIVTYPDSNHAVCAACYHRLEGEFDRSLELSAYRLDKQQSAWAGLQAALVADRMGNPARRDELLKEVEKLGPQPEDSAEEVLPGVAMATMWIEDLEAGGNGKFDRERLTGLLVRGNSKDRLILLFSMGKYLELHGQLDRAICCYKLCMQRTSEMSHVYRTLAGASLIENGVSYDDYCEVLREDFDLRTLPLESIPLDLDQFEDGKIW